MDHLKRLMTTSQERPWKARLGCVKTGDKAPVILLELESEDLVKVFNSLYENEIVNPKGAACQHSLFAHAKQDASEGPNRYGFAPHVTLCEFPKGTSLETVKKGTRMEDMNAYCPKGQEIEITFDDVVFESW